MAGPTKQPFVKALAIAGVFLAAGILTFIFALGSPSDPYRASGAIAFITVAPALITGFFARRSQKVWPFWKILGIYLLTLIVLAVINLAGRVDKQ
jgi:hypothetical protein